MSRLISQQSVRPSPWETESWPSLSFCDRTACQHQVRDLRILRRLFLYLGLQQDAEQLGYQWGVVCLSTLREVICLRHGDVSPLWHATLFFFTNNPCPIPGHQVFIFLYIQAELPVACSCIPQGLIVRVLNVAPRHDDMWGGVKATCIVELQHSVEVLGQLRASK